MANLSSAISSALASPHQNGTSNSSVISEVLRIYDEYEGPNELRTPDKVQLTNDIEANKDSPGSTCTPLANHHLSLCMESDVPCNEFSVDNCLDTVKEQKIQNEVQPTNAMESDNASMDDSNVIPYEQYVKHCEESVVPSDASSAQDELHEYSVFPDDSIHTRLNIQKDQLAWYEQCAKFELTEREQMMKSQMCTFIIERNLREETLNEKIVFLQKQLEQSIKQKQEIQESFQVSFQELKQNFKEKETKLVHDFPNLKT